MAQAAGKDQPLLRREHLDPGRGLSKHQRGIRAAEGSIHGQQHLVGYRLDLSPAGAQQCIGLGGGQGNLDQAQQGFQAQPGVLQERPQHPGIRNLPDLAPERARCPKGEGAPLAGGESAPEGLEPLQGHGPGLGVGGRIFGQRRQQPPGQPGQQGNAQVGRGLAVLGDPAKQLGPSSQVRNVRSSFQPTPGWRGMPQQPQELGPGQVGRKEPIHGPILAKIGHTAGMEPLFTILGRGRAGRALAEAWDGRVALAPHEADPGGLVLLAVPDHAIPCQAARFQGRCVHLSGSLHLQDVPSAHPLTSFRGRAEDWGGTPLALTGSVPEPIREAFVAVGFLPFELPVDQKALYHACAVLTSGHAASLWLGAARLLAEAGLELPGRGLLPLAEATLANVAREGARGRTGPFVRGDEATIQRDAEALPEAWRRVFLELGRLG